MASNRTIHIRGDISEDSFISFRKKVMKCIKENKKPINVILTSGGGDAYAALAFYDFITSLDFDLRIHATGLVASAAVLILAAARHRTMSPSAWVMCHEDQPTFEDTARVTELERDIAHARRLEDQWNKLLSLRTNRTADEWGKIHKVETYLTANECFSAGLIDDII